MVFCSGCEYKLRPNDDTDRKKIEIKRYDRLQSQYLTTGDFSALQQMNTEFPIETRTLIEDILHIGEVDDPEISKTLLKYYQDSTLQVIMADVEVEYANIDDINKSLNDAFGKLRTYIPDIQTPEFYAQIGDLEHSIIIGDGMVGISLDKYMGENYPIYRKYYNHNQRESMTRGNITSDCICFYLLSLYPLDNLENRSQLDRDLHTGKIMWVSNLVVGKNVFRTKYVECIDAYMRKHSSLTVLQLLLENDHDDIIKKTGIE
ncbi:MAG: gliding motility protein GldB [Prevotella sp.]|uniref:gliding motility protein GldB-related protein n=1 Tax=Prevotella sp. TaxID=59823 RepID=UPI002A295107|nr:gliding motility protein GldB [Prevotella sp.]MDD7319181.1 gliding motility protein GldB [Prevotellaceae bacterium]MDY4020049.1 gliding motility protein GldB [Prevotella sp.]